MNIANRIRKSRLNVGLTQAELAKNLGVTRNAISLWESGRNNPSSHNLLNISRILDVNYSWLALGADAQPDSDGLGKIHDGIEVAGTIEQNTWRGSAELINPVSVPLPRDDRYPAARQLAWRVQGPKDQNWGIDAGTFVVSADYDKWVEAYGGPKNGALVVVQRVRSESGEREYSLRKVRIRGEALDLLGSSASEEPILTVPMSGRISGEVSAGVVGPIISIYRQI